jgi:hypothetical protein
MSGTHAVWKFTGPGAGYAYAEGQRGLSVAQQNAIFFGEPLPDPLPEAEITALSEGMRGHLIGSSFSAFIVSRPARELLEGRAPVQFIPARLPRGAAGDYAILNALASVPCFDYHGSEYERLAGDPRQILTVRRLVLRELPRDAPSLFHLAELPGALLVDEALRADLLKLDDGIGELVPVEDFTWGVG